MRGNMKSLLFFMFTLTTTIFSGSKHFVLISAPGSGKGTFSQYLVEKYKYVQICPGDIFRNEIKEQTDLGKKIQPIVEKGDYVDEDIVCNLVATGISNALDQKQPFIIDGFPRSALSFQFLSKFLEDRCLTQDVIFLQFTASDEACINRISSRCVCVQCFKVYNTFSFKPNITNKCDNCSINLVMRPADTKVIAQKRLQYFHENIEPLMGIAQKNHTTKYINTMCSSQSLKGCYEQLIK